MNSIITTIVIVLVYDFLKSLFKEDKDSLEYKERKYREYMDDRDAGRLP